MHVINFYYDISRKIRLSVIITGYYVLRTLSDVVNFYKFLSKIYTFISVIITEIKTLLAREMVAF